MASINIACLKLRQRLSQEQHGRRHQANATFIWRKINWKFGRTAKFGEERKTKNKQTFSIRDIISLICCVAFSWSDQLYVAGRNSDRKVFSIHYRNFLYYFLIPVWRCRSRVLWVDEKFQLFVNSNRNSFILYLWVIRSFVGYIRRLTFSASPVDEGSTDC